MTYALEYHLTEQTIQASKDWRSEWIAIHKAKHLGMWPAEIRPQMEDLVDESGVYGDIEYIVLPELHLEWFANTFGPGLVQPVEIAPDNSWVRVTFDSKAQAGQAKAQIRKEHS